MDYIFHKARNNRKGFIPVSTHILELDSKVYKARISDMDFNRLKARISILDLTPYLKLAS